jgi:hypothetical protein
VRSRITSRVFSSRHEQCRSAWPAPRRGLAIAAQPVQRVDGDAIVMPLKCGHSWRTLVAPHEARWHSDRGRWRPQNLARKRDGRVPAAAAPGKGSGAIGLFAGFRKSVSQRVLGESKPAESEYIGPQRIGERGFRRGSPRSTASMAGGSPRLGMRAPRAFGTTCFTRLPLNTPGSEIRERAILLGRSLGPVAALSRRTINFGQLQMGGRRWITI